MNLYNKGDKEEAFKESKRLDTYQRELIPPRIYKDMGGKLTSMKTLTIDQKEQALRDINFFVGGLTDEAIEYYYNKLIV